MGRLCAVRSRRTRVGCSPGARAGDGTRVAKAGERADFCVDLCLRSPGRSGGLSRNTSRAWTVVGNGVRLRGCEGTEEGLGGDRR
jgi:hypothetical protein